jgi:hypothetical protein
VLTGEDAGFSSFSYLDYFLSNPAFALVYSERPSAHDGAYVFHIDRTRLAPRPYRAAVDPESLAALQRATALSPEEIAAGIDPDGISRQ